MPARQNVKTIPTPLLQGEDSWVKIKALTVEQYNRNQAIQRDARQPDADPEDLEQRTSQLFSEVVLDWNWVDDAGQPLPKPQGNPQVFRDGLLTMPELFFIAEALRPTDGEKKDKPS